MRLSLIESKVLRALGLCVAAGALFAFLELPLPWMIGPLLAMAAGKSFGLALAAPPAAREGGQAVIAVALGLYFTPQVSLEVSRYLPWMLLAGAVAIFTGFCGSLISRALMGKNAAGRHELDAATAFFSSIPGGASEMAVLADRFGGRVDRVAFAQSLRILLVVMSIPFIYTYADIHGLDRYQQSLTTVDPVGLAALLGLGLCGGALAAWFRAPNAFMLGPLSVTICLTALDFRFSAMPGWLSSVGQLCLGCALGAKFERDFFRSAPRFMLTVAIATLSAMLLTGAFSLVLWQLAGIHPSTGMLAVAPGGIAEMCITAKLMQLGVPVVTAFHVARVMLLVSFSGWVYRRFLAREGGNR